MDKCDTRDAFEIRKMSEGGYLVGYATWRSDSYNPPFFASSTVDEALKFIRAKLEPKK